MAQIKSLLSKASTFVGNLDVLYKALFIVFTVIAVSGVSYVHFYTDSSAGRKDVSASSPIDADNSSGKSALNREHPGSVSSADINSSSSSNDSTSANKNRTQSSQSNANGSGSDIDNKSSSSSNPNSSNTQQSNPSQSGSSGAGQQQTQNPPIEHHPTYNLNRTIYVVGVGGMSCSKPANQINESNESKLCTNIPGSCDTYIGISYTSTSDAGNVATQNGNNSQPSGKYFSPRCGGGGILGEAQCQTYGLSCGRW